MRKQKLMIGQYSNTTRVSAEKIPALLNFLFAPQIKAQIESAGKTGLSVPIPFDIYEYMSEKFHKFEKEREDKKKQKGLILFVDHTPYCILSQRDKIWFHHCPDCGTPTKTIPYEAHKDVFECAECHEIFHESREKGTHYI